MLFFYKNPEIDEDRKPLALNLTTEKKFEEVKEDKQSFILLYLSKILILVFALIILTGFQEEINSGLSSREPQQRPQPQPEPPAARPIKVAFYCNSIKYGGGERVVALLINLLEEEKNFTIYLITNQGVLEGEYSIPNSTKRISLSEKKMNIFRAIRTEHIDIFIYNSYSKSDIKKLNRLKKTEVIYYNHSGFFYWIYQQIYKFKDTIYEIYKECKYIISLIPLENDYLFKKWGINSILMDNPLTFEYDSVIPSDLSQNNIVMIGRGNDINKRFDIGIKSMKNIIEEIPDCKMYIISDKFEELEKLIKSLNLEKNVIFTGYQKNIEEYLKNSSLHIFPSIAESYGLVMSETKIYGIPTILCGLDYITFAKGGTVIIYDDNPNTIAKEAIKILKNETYKKKLGVEARKSLDKHNNNVIAKRWVKLLLAVYKGDNKSFRELEEDKMTEEEAERILNNQLKLIHMRVPRLKDITLEQLKSYSLL